MKTVPLFTALLALTAFLATPVTAQRVYQASDFGLRPGMRNASPAMQRLLKKVKAECTDTDSIVIRFDKGQYHFHPKGAAERVCYISNHDQDTPAKRVGIALEDLNHLTLDGGGAEFIFHGRMLPVALQRSADCTLRNFSIDFAHPHIAQAEIVENHPQRGITFRPAPWVQYRVTRDSLFETYGEDWTVCPGSGIAFEPGTRHIVYDGGDRGCTVDKGVYATGDGLVHATRWHDRKLTPGTVFVMRGWGRPAPGIFLYQNKNTRVEHVRVHYAEGMGLLAQLCENVTLDGFGVCLKGDDDPRYFTTQADATHFSGCKGRIVSVNGLYEGMMDDAINVHGTYLKLMRQTDSHTWVARYMHGQSWGFLWGEPGDEVQFISPRTMETAGTRNRIVAIRPFGQEQTEGAREFVITFEQPADSLHGVRTGFGVENLTWTPEVRFAHNTVRNNRARGALFSTPRRVEVTRNTFDHTSGTAILLCGDCNGWYETGACRDVTICHNRFVNALTSRYQFTEGIISIYPEIPELDRQQAYFHENIRIEDNRFETFGVPVLYAKSVKGLLFRRNTVKRNADYPPLWPDVSLVRLERVTDAVIGD